MRLTRLSPAKVEFLARGIAQIHRRHLVLELFSGGGTASKVIQKTCRKLISVDIAPTGNAIRADARHLPFLDNTFDVVLAPDSPRTAWDRLGFGTDGNECNLTPDEQRQLFLDSAQEAWRVLKYGGVFAATAPSLWVESLPDVKIIPPPSRRLGFCGGQNSVVYLRFVK